MTITSIIKSIYQSSLNFTFLGPVNLKIASPKCVTLVRWYPPSPGIIKINIDESVRLPSSKAGAAAVIRDYEGKWVHDSQKIEHTRDF